MISNEDIEAFFRIVSKLFNDKTISQYEFITQFLRLRTLCDVLSYGQIIVVAQNEDIARKLADQLNLYINKFDISIEEIKMCVPDFEDVEIPQQ